MRLIIKNKKMKLKVEKNIELRQIKLSDAAEIFSLVNSQREYLGEWLPFVKNTKEQKDTETFIKSKANAPEEKSEYIFTIRKKNVFIGIISLVSTNKKNKKTEIGYWLSENEQKQGIITKSVKKLCGFVFNELEFNRIQIKCATGNEPSKNIPKRLGFKFEGIERDGELFYENTFYDLEVYSLLKKEFLPD